MLESEICALSPLLKMAVSGGGYFQWKESAILIE